MRRTMWITIALVSLGSLSACSTAQPYGIFEDPQTDEDSVPVVGLGPEGSVLDAASTRNLGSYEGNTFYVAKVVQDEGNPIEPGICLIVIEDEAEDPVSGCSTVSSFMQMQTQTANVILIPDDYDRTQLPGGEWVDVHPNLLSR